MGQHLITVSVILQFLLDKTGLEALLARLPGLEVVPFDSSAPPRVLVFDYRYDGGNRLPEISTPTALVLLIEGDECPELLPMDGPKVLGLFSKNESVEALSIAIRQVARGEAYLSPALALSLMKRKQSRETLPKIGLSMLTEREREVLALLAEGLSNKAIGARLYLSVRTIDGHLSNLYARLGVRSRTEAMRLAIEHGLVSRIR